MLKKTGSSVKFFKWIFGSILLVVLLLVASSWYISIKIKPLIKQQIKTLVQKSTNGLYHIQFAAIHTNFITGSATIADVVIKPDTVVFKQIIAQKKAPNNLYYLKLKTLSIKNFNPFTIYFDKKLNINLLLFNKPSITMVNKHFDFNDNRPPRPRKSPYDYISKLFKSVNVNVVDFKDAKFKYINNNGLIPEVDSVANLNVTLKDWLIDSLSAQDTTRLYLLKDVNVYLNNYRYATPDSLYYFKVNQIDYTASSQKLNLKQFELVPRYNQNNFAKMSGYAKDRYSILFNNISLSGINLPAYVQKKEVIANEMNILDGNIAVFNNNTYLNRSFNKTGKFPHQLLQQIKTQLTIKKIKLSNINISYAEFDKSSLQTGKISFEKTTGIINNVTNTQKEKAINPIMEANFISYLMGQGKLNLNFKFNLASPIGAFTYQGDLNNLDGRTLNRITKPLGRVQINKVNIKQLAFNIAANQTVAKGKVSFAFNNLSLALMKKKQGKEKLVRQGFISFLANSLVIFSNNPSKEGKFTIAPINYKRESTASFFSFIWRTLFEGVKYSVGITSQKEAQVRAQIAKFEKMREERGERRFRRQLRKDKRK